MDKATISKQLAEARRGISRGLDGVAWEANVPRKVMTSVKKKPAAWILISAALGFIIAYVFGGKRPKKIKIEGPTKKVDAKAAWYAGIPLALVRLALPVIQPLVVDFLSKKVPTFAKAGPSRRP